MYVNCDFLLLTSEEKLFGPHHFFELATPLHTTQFFFPQKNLHRPHALAILPPTLWDGVCLA